MLIIDCSDIQPLISCQADGLSFGPGWLAIHALVVVVLIHIAIKGSRVGGGSIGKRFPSSAWLFKAEFITQ